MPPAAPFPSVRVIGEFDQHRLAGGIAHAATVRGTGARLSAHEIASTLTGKAAFPGARPAHGGRYPTA
jgi:hypothetical protein